MHRAALALGIAAAPAGELGHHALRIHAAGQHVTVIAVAGDHLIAIAFGHFHADDDGFLADVEVAEAADQAHAVHLAGLLLETADQQHLPERVEFLFLVEFRAGRRRRLRSRMAQFRQWFSVLGLGNGHQHPRESASSIP